MRLAQRTLGIVPSVAPVTVPVFVADGEPAPSAEYAPPVPRDVAPGAAREQRPPSRRGDGESRALQAARATQDTVSGEMSSLAEGSSPPPLAVSPAMARPERKVPYDADPRPAFTLGTKGARGTSEPLAATARETGLHAAAPTVTPLAAQLPHVAHTKDAPGKGGVAAPVNAASPLPRAGATRPAAPRHYVNVTIGRIDVRAVQATSPPKPARKANRRSPALTLDEYMKQRGSGRR